MGGGKEEEMTNEPIKNGQISYMVPLGEVNQSD